MAITEADIKRINELYHKSQAEGLTDEEKQEQQDLFMVHFKVEF